MNLTERILALTLEQSHIALLAIREGKEIEDAVSLAEIYH